MKIGIVTYHRAYNYGALLQAIATRVYLQSLGHDVSYIDYWPQYHADSYKLFNKSKFVSASFLGKIKYLLSFTINYWGNKKRFSVFSPFLAKYILPYCKPFEDTTCYDVVLYGSDQIWRKQSDGKYNWVYFGQNKVKADKHVSFSASMGKVDFDEISYNTLRANLSNLYMIGVRESDLADVIRGMGFDVTNTIDPTLLLNKNQWDEVIPTKRIIKEPYLLMYDIGPSFRRSEVEKLAKNKGLRLIVVGPVFDIRRRKDRLFTSPAEFISLIKFADFVLTSSYHGLMFSIIYEKQFIASFMKNPARAESIMKSIGLKEYLLEYKQPLPTSLNMINYHIVNDKIDILKKDSIEFLKHIDGENRDN